MQRFLLRHPRASPSPVQKIGVDAARLVDGQLSLVYMATGDIGRLRIPSRSASVRMDGLWRHTCFEAFVRPLKGDAYFEFNFAPSFEWAAYRFDSYRSGMSPADVAAPLIKCQAGPEHLSLVVSIDLGPLPEFIPWDEWLIGLSAVMEAEDGTTSHWALSHPQGAANFHDRHCFAGQLAPAASL